MADPSAPALRMPDDVRVWALLAALAGALAWGASLVAVKPVLGLLALIVGAMVVGVVTARPELGVAMLAGASALDVMGRVASVGGANVTVYQLGTLAVGIAFVKRYGDELLRPLRTPVDLPVAAYLLFAFASLPGAVVPKTALVTFASLLTSVILLYACVLAIRDARTAVTVILAVAALAGVFGLLAVVERQGIWSIQPFLKIWNYGIRARVTFKDPNVFGSFLVTALALGAPLVFAARSKVQRVLLALALAAALVGLVVTFSRGAWAAFMVAMLVVLILGPFSPRIKLLLAVLGAALVAVVLLRVLDPAWVQKYLVNLTENRSFMYRFYIGQASWNMFLDHPMGVGLGNYSAVFPEYRPGYVALRLVESHTAYLTVLAETGLLGLIAFLGVIWRFGKGTLRAARHAVDPVVRAVAVGALAAGAALLTQSLTYSLELSNFLWLTFGIGMAMYRIDRLTEEETV